MAPSYLFTHKLYFKAKVKNNNSKIRRYSRYHGDKSVYISVKGVENSNKKIKGLLLSIFRIAFISYIGFSISVPK